MSSPIAPRFLGGNASHVAVGCIGIGLSTLSKPVNGQTVSDDQAFSLLRTAIRNGATYWNTATFYGTPQDPWANIKLLGRFFEKYPEYTEKVVLSVKGGFNPSGNFANLDSSEPNFRRELHQLRSLLGNKKVDIYGPGRRDTKISVEESTATLAKLSKEGLFSYIGLSELSASSVRAAAQVHPIALVEIEYSPFTMDMETNGILQACKDNNVAIVAYSPLSRGFFTGTLRKRSDLPQDDIRLKFDRFNEENFDLNVQLADKTADLAESIGVSPAQLTLAWELSRYEKLIPVPGTTKEQNMLHNLDSGRLSVAPSVFQAFDALARGVNDKVAGTRFNPLMNKMLNG